MSGNIHAIIKQLTVTEAQETLGIWSCLAGTVDVALEALQTKVVKWVTRAQ
jgi:hypothetical protein